MTVKRGARMAGRSGTSPGPWDASAEGDGVGDVDAMEGPPLSVDWEERLIPDIEGVVVGNKEGEAMTAEGDAMGDDGEAADPLGLVPRGPAPVWSWSSEVLLGKVIVEAGRLPELALGTWEFGGGGGDSAVEISGLGESGEGVSVGVDSVVGGGA